MCVIAFIMGAFRFKQFSVDDSRCGMKIGTDGVLLGAWACADGARCVLDVGTGSGLIALMMAQRYPDITIIGVDIDPSACMDTRANADCSPWSERIVVVNRDVRDCGTIMQKPEHVLPISRPLSIVSNPPFFSETLRSPDASRAMARHGAGFGVEALVNWCGGVMTGCGDSMSFIAPAGRDGDIQYRLSLCRLTATRVTDVISRAGSRPVRRLYEVRRECDVAEPCSYDELIIREASGELSLKYKSLTEPFYLDK